MGAETTDTTDTTEQATASNVRAPFAPWDRRDLPGSFDVTETALIQSLGYGRAQVKSDIVAVGATVLRTTVDFRPSTYSAGAYFSF